MSVYLLGLDNNSPQGVGDEITCFLCTTARKDSACDPLVWWNDHSKHFSTFYTLARYITSFQSTSAASVATFSEAETLVVDKSSTLNDESIPAKKCIRSWRGALYCLHDEIGRNGRQWCLDYRSIDCAGGSSLRCVASHGEQKTAAEVGA